MKEEKKAFIIDKTILLDENLRKYYMEKKRKYEDLRDLQLEVLLSLFL